MATYAIGDVQGCADELDALLREIHFNPDSDQLWFVGDLVNSGPKSLDVLRRVYSLRDNVVVTLGNHDLKLLAVACGAISVGPKDTFQDALDAPDREPLLVWLQERPLVHCEHEYTMVHAGLSPQWTSDDACLYGYMVSVLKNALFLFSAQKAFFEGLRGDHPNNWDSVAWTDETLSKLSLFPEKAKEEALHQTRFAINALTRMRYVNAQDGSIDVSQMGPPGTESEAKGLIPWFACEVRKSVEEKVIFGHWASLYDIESDTFHCNPHDHNVIPLDTCCVYGGYLTAYCLETGEYHRVRGKSYKKV
jgi:bis(5'-nucleosyl)-tetraphosphatase (symmetrical)